MRFTNYFAMPLRISKGLRQRLYHQHLLMLVVFFFHKKLLASVFSYVPVVKGSIEQEPEFTTIELMQDMFGNYK